MQCKSHLTPPMSWQVTRRETLPIQSIPTIPSTTAGIWATEEEEEGHLNSSRQHKVEEDIASEID